MKRKHPHFLNFLVMQDYIIIGDEKSSAHRRYRSAPKLMSDVGR